MQLRATLPDAVGGVLWFGPHAALTTVFTPFVAGMHASDSTFEVGHQCKPVMSFIPFRPLQPHEFPEGLQLSLAGPQRLADRRERVYRSTDAAGVDIVSVPLSACLSYKSCDD